MVFLCLAETGDGSVKVECTVPDFPHDASRGSHTLSTSTKVYVDRSDVSVVHDSDFFGMMAGQVVGLKYLGKVLVEAIEQDNEGNVSHIRVAAVPPSDATKPKSTIQWVPFATSVPATVSALSYGP